MFDKSFVSIYFQSRGIYILHLDSRRKKLRKNIFLELPEGIIVDNQVKDSESLSKVISSTFEKNRISEKSVSLIIPEYTTLTKILSAPALSKTDLDEAVRWQASEFLPTSKKGLLMDWKIVEKGPTQNKVLIAAIDKETISGYVDAVESARLFPLVVETPALALSRYAGKLDQEAILIIYGQPDEILFVVSKGEAIYGTSVTTLHDNDDVVKTASRITMHYKEAGVKKIMFCGKIDERLITKIKSVLGMDSEWINPKISGFSQTQVQDFIVAVCSQFNDLDEPSDPSSLNLLPIRLVEKYNKEKTRLQIWSLTLTITLFVSISFFLTLGSFYFLDAQYKETKAKNMEKIAVSESREKSISDIKYINDLVAKIQKIKKITTTPRIIMNDIKAALPPGVTIENYKFTLELGIIEVQGIAANRTALIEFKNNLEKNDKVGSVEIPISSFEKDVNLEFKLSYNFLPISSQVQPKR